jgi:hypothetical protein
MDNTLAINCELLQELTVPSWTDTFKSFIMFNSDKLKIAHPDLEGRA